MNGPLRNAKQLLGCAIRATDGDIGTVVDLYFDDERWAVRYLVVDTGGWLTGRKVLISPRAVGEPDWDANVLPVSLTKTQVENSPDIDTKKPVSRQHEAEHSGYYEYPFYWGGSGLWGMGEYPGDLGSQIAIEAELRANQDAELHANQDAELRASQPAHSSGDSHLQNFDAIVGYPVSTPDGATGHVEDLLIDAVTWAIRDLVVKADGREVLIAPEARLLTRAKGSGQR